MLHEFHPSARSAHAIDEIDATKQSFAPPPTDERPDRYHVPCNAAQGPVECGAPATGDDENQSHSRDLLGLAVADDAVVRVCPAPQG
jgi:hypothetical protein